MLVLARIFIYSRGIPTPGRDIWCYRLQRSGHVAPCNVKRRLSAQLRHRRAKLSGRRVHNHAMGEYGSDEERRASKDGLHTNRIQFMTEVVSECWVKSETT